MRIGRNPFVLFILLLPLSFVPRFFGGSLEVWALWLLLWYFIIPLAISLVLGFRLGELGIKLPRDNWRVFSLLLGLALVLSFAGLLVPSMVTYYPNFAYSNWAEFFRKELVIGVVMFTHEAFFRGFLLFPLAREKGWLGIIAQDIPYAIVHIGKPPVEVPYSLAAGLFFGWMDLKGKSFLQSFLLHWLGSAFFDFLCVLVKTGVI